MFFAATAIYAHCELYYELGWGRYIDTREPAKVVEEEPVKKVKDKKK